MPNCIILRLIPPAAISGAEFTNYLDGLMLTVFDVSYQFAAEVGTPPPASEINSVTYSPIAAAYPLGPALIQHVVPFFLIPLSVATAVIEYSGPPSFAEFIAPDLRIKFTRGSVTTYASRIYYDVPIQALSPINPNSFQLISNSEISAYVTLPPPPAAGSVSLAVPADGTPPIFAGLLAAVRSVLTDDPATPINPDEIAKLTIDQCKNIAYEIVYGPQMPLPIPTDSLENMYTDPPNLGGYTNTNELSRLQFEGQLAGYYGPSDATALQLTNYVFSLSAAVYCRLQSRAATTALIEFPVNPNAPGGTSTLATISEAQIAFAGAINCEVPAEYFYALTYDMSPQVTKDQRYQMAVGADLTHNLARLTTGVNQGFITVPGGPLVNPAQAVRILQALDLPIPPSVPKWNVPAVPGGAAHRIWNDWHAFPTTANWLAYTPSDDVTVFWTNEATIVSGTPFLELVLYTLTRGFVINPGGHLLAFEIRTRLGLTEVTDLTNLTPNQWTIFFNTLPGLLGGGVTFADVMPPFVGPGNQATQIAAFIRYLLQFFQMKSLPAVIPIVTPTPPDQYGVPSFDLIALTIADYPGFVFGNPLSLPTLEAAAAAAVPGDPEAQAWAVQAVWTINELFIVATVGQPASVEFSVMEALFARGFTSRDEVEDLSFADFQQALTGTVAYEFATQIYTNAGPPIPVPPSLPPGFGPVNPCCLTDCIPPLYLSPLGPVAYLHEMLRASERSTCEDPFAHPAPGHARLEAHIAARRGPVQNLAVTRSNLETPLPLVDIVNECLEYMASTSPITKHGVIHDTSEETLAGFKLCGDECRDDECCNGETHHKKEHCHDPVILFDALPEYSTPVTHVAANGSIEPPVWGKLRANFSTCCLPYDQPLDVSRTYLDHLRTCRYETMRTFRRCITEFVLDPDNQPAKFETYLWRYPVRIDIAIEYLHISPEEYVTLFQGVWPRPCGSREDRREEGPRDQVDPWEVYGFDSERVENVDWTEIVIRLPEFLKRTCLTYCEFIDFWKCGVVAFGNGHDREGVFPDCEPCCLEDLWLKFHEERAAAGLWELAVFIRLWRKLRHICGADYTVCQLADICKVLHFPNPHFIRQLAAFQMLRDQFRLKLSEGKAPAGTTGADRTYLLSLWVGPVAKHWPWAVQQLIEGIAYHAECRHRCERRGPEFLKLLASNLNPLSRLAGFEPLPALDTWHVAPTHTLRFAEVLAKIYASSFSIGEILFLFTVEPHLDGEDPFPLQTVNDADNLPLGLPNDDHRHSLWQLRRKLLHVDVPDREAHEWSWRRIESALEHEFGFAPADVLAFGEHFFPDILEAQGQPVTALDRRFTSNLLVTNAAMWNTPPEGPFHYDSTAHKLWAVLPLADDGVIEQLIRLQPLKPPEQEAVQDVYFQPRALLASFALLFANFGEAERRLIAESNHEDRWRYFQRQFCLCRARCRILAQHLAEHVEAVTREERPEGLDAALLLLKELYADENFATADWENDNGQVPAVTWVPRPNGGALAALLGLAGTGLYGEFEAGGKLVWREVRGPISAFGHERDRASSPIPTVIPSMGLVLTPEQLLSATVRNGFAMDDATGRWLGGGEGFGVKWHGALLVDEEGEYRFIAGSPSPGHEEPSALAARHRSWKVTLKRGNKVWVVLRHDWHGEENLRVESLPLKRGAYELTAEFVQHTPLFHHPADETHPRTTGFEIKYSGPDTDHTLVAIPHDRLFRVEKDHTLEVAGPAGSPALFLSRLYSSSLRDVRRTYQRAFKALLFAHRFALSAEPRSGEGSELGYILARKDRFAGSSCYRNAGVFTIHRADFDFNFLPVGDDYHPPAHDSRAHPSARRIQAMFDWWERIFDYDRVRAHVRLHCERHLWLLFVEAFEIQPADPASLLRHMCADARHWSKDLHYFQDQFSPIYPVTSTDLEDDRWVVRAWHADQWLSRLWRRFTVKDIAEARPDLWAADFPGELVPGSGPQAGNANLRRFVEEGCFENGQPERYEDIERLNDGLRQRGREAIISYLCGPQGIVHTSNDLSAILLMDVRAGLAEKASRIEEAVSAVQAFILRSRLGLEPGWNITEAFARMWDSRFVSFHVWQACKRRELYKENFVDWNELEKAQKVEGFRFLDEELKRVALTIARPGGVDYWPNHRPPIHPGLCLLQERDAAEMQIVPAPRQGLDLLARPERDARPSWITMVPEPAAPPQRDAGAALPPAPAVPALKLPFWIECAIRLGKRFLRVAAATYPPASTELKPRHICGHALGKPKQHPDKDECCVSCCPECGCVHPAHVDEYWFWLIDANYFDPQNQPVYTAIFDGQQQSYYDQNAQDATPWHQPAKLHALLEWPPEPMVRLAWCRVHNGEFQQPRRSVWGVPVNAIGTPDFTFEGRVADSLYFDVTDSVSGTAGFRYDMVPDLAIEFDDLIVPTAPPPPGFPGGLIGYPYFTYFEPGARLFPWSLFSPSVAVAHSLRAHCRFEAALKWYDLVYDPLHHDNRWARCEKEEPPRSQQRQSDANEHDRDGTAVPHRGNHHPAHEHSCCCDTTKVSCHEARLRSILLHYLEALLEWSGAVMRRDSPEEAQRAILLLETMRHIMGPHPHMVKNHAKVHQTVGTFDPLPAPVNPRLMMLYDRLDDRAALIHDRSSARRLQEGSEKRDARYWGNDPVRDGWRTMQNLCCDADGWCHLHSPYRFEFLIQKAKELTTQVRELGAALLSAFEKGDAEFLGAVRARHERELALLGRKSREDQWRDADWQVQALEQTKAADQSDRTYYWNLIAAGLNSNENGYVNNTGVANGSRTAANVLEAVAEAMDIVPDIWVGTVEDVQLPIGTKLAGLFKTLARVSNTIADIANTTAGLDLTEGGWDRRQQDWTQRVAILDIQIEQVELQILGAERRRHQALRELNIQERQIEHATEMLDLLRDKFTNHAAYLFLQKYVADLYYQTYDLALRQARQAEHAFNFERGYTARKFIGCEYWDNLHEGLLAGERLQLDLARMEKEYCDLNRREYELTKHISMRLFFPREFLRLKVTGRCEIELPEWMFDLDYPGQYMRRIKNVTLTIPCVSGPYNEVHCRLTLLRSATRVDPLLSPPAARCCQCCQSENGYPACPHDPRVVRQYGAREAIATSTGQNDAGLFELSFRDERYLPFEFHGAVSRWRVELPQETNYFAMETLSDLILHLNYTSREGGERLRRAATDASRCHLPGDGWCLFDLPHDFADAWELFRRDRRVRPDDRHRDDHERRHDEHIMALRLSRSMFPFIPGRRELFIERMALFFNRCEHCSCECPGECACCADPTPATCEVELERGHHREKERLRCVLSDHWPGLYHGVVDTRIGPLHSDGERVEVKFRFSEDHCRITQAYLLCRYKLEDKCPRIEKPPTLRCNPCDSD